MPDDIGEARKALADGDFARARAHLAVARQEGADETTLRALLDEIDEAEGAITKSSSAHILWAIMLALIAYVVLSLQSPANWGMPVWVLLAFIVVPIVIGVLSAMSVPPHAEKGDRFKRAMGVATLAMAIYATVGLILSERKMGTHSLQATQVFTAGMVVVVVYALIAGFVAGFAGSLVRGR